MVTEMDSHQVASTLDRLCEFIIYPTRANAPTGMIMAENDDGGIVHDGLFHNDTDINRSFSNTTLADAYRLYKLVVLIEKNHMAFLHLQVLHLGIHVVINGGSGA